MSGRTQKVTARWRVERLTSSLGEWAIAWDVLNRQLFNAHPLLESRFVEGLLKYFSDSSAYICVLEINGVPEAMCLLRPKGLGVWETLLPSQAQIGPVLMKRPKALYQLMDALPGTVVRLDLLCNDPEYGDMSEASDATSTVTNHALTMSVRLDGDFDSYWSTRSKNLLKNIARYQRRAKTDDFMSAVRCVTEPASVSGAVARYADLESRGWKGKQGTALEAENRQGLFYSELMSRFAETHGAMVFELWFDDHLVASRLVIASTHMIVILKTTYDEAFEKYAPGRLLLREVIQELFATHPGKVLEFYTDANADQLAWATRERWIKHVSIYRNAFAEYVFQILAMTRRMCKHSRPPFRAVSDTLAISVYRHPDELPPDVLHFFDQAEKECIEWGATWYRNLVDTVYIGSNGVWIYVLRKNDRPVAALPILSKRKLSGQRVNSLSNYYTSVYAPIVDTTLRIHEFIPLVSAIKCAHSPTETLRFAPMDPKSFGFCILLEALKACNLLTNKFFCFGNRYLPIVSDWPDYLHNRSGILRSTIKRMKKKFLAEGGAFEVISGGSNLEPGLVAYEKIYASSWKKQEPYPNFIRGLAHACAERNWLRLGVARLKGRPIAAQIWIVANRKASIFKLAHAEDSASYAPGTLLTAMLMEYSIDKEKVVEVDFMTGDDSYKSEWMSHRRERWGIVAYNPKTFFGLCAIGKTLLSIAATTALTWAKSRFKLLSTKMETHGVES